MLQLAMKEWAVVCDLLVEGRLALLLRKGGIHEEAGPGRFRLEHPRFALFPAWEHQDPRKIKPNWCADVQEYDREPDELAIKGYAQVDHIWEVPCREAFDSLEDLHCWKREQIDMRFNYKPDRPLYLMAVRAQRLSQPKTIANHPRYAGCRSWVDLDAGDAIDVSDALPAMDDAHFVSLVERVAQAMA